MTLIIVILIAVLAAAGFVSFRKRVSKGCCESGDDNAVSKIEIDEDKTHYPYSETVHIEGMHCDNCVRKVRNAYAEKNCLAEVSLKRKEAVVHMKKKLSDEMLTAIPERIGYEAYIQQKS